MNATTRHQLGPTPDGATVAMRDEIESALRGFEGVDVAAPGADDEVLAVNEALDKLAMEYPLQAELVKLRYFAGMTNEEASVVLGFSVSTAKNYWNFSRAWL